MVRMADGTKTLIRDAELRAEQLIGYLRLLISSSLGVVFAVVLTVEPVPLTEVLRWQLVYASGTMAAYFMLGLLSLFLLSKGWFRRWMIWPSAFGDCVFLLISSWLSVVNTGLPGSHVVVLPTIWLIPVVLACGALRFNPALQAAMASVIVGGMFYLLAAEATLGPAAVEANIRFFFAMPPNLMRVAMIALAGGVLVVASLRIRRLLLRSITEAEARANLTRYLPAQLAPRLAHVGLEELRRGARAEMAVLFVDMRGFTQISERMRPEQVSEFVTAYRTRITAVAQETGGIIDKFMGDAAMLVFEDADGRAARAALHCADLLAADIDTWSEQRQRAGDEPVQIGVGLHWGEVFVGVVGDDARLEYSVFGDTVNIAARLEALTKAHGVPMIASDVFLQRARVTTEDWQVLPDHSVRGRIGHLTLYARN
ncbi:adenylate/guanylate cyclase domain-containing protein [Thalassococcus sp. S3]|uniref:adenylate/guanylate cyclase domain-containing protein n=1 Tax=Thalassococcus sp. S3 TaxID=2017482 RepID=UPI0013EED614|nr:adenylate/guanylate cyclase domain-containing protein [Thalassococcus sp. S3]